MAWLGSYLERLRRKVGHDLVLMPGSVVRVEHEDGRILFVRRADDGTWCHPGGHAEPGMGFAESAIRELFEEGGITVDPGELRPFASVSEEAVHSVVYPNGDRTHCFTMWFALTGWDGDPSTVAIDDESTDIGWFAPDELPEPMSPPTALAMELYERFVESGDFQAR